MTTPAPIVLNDITVQAVIEQEACTGFAARSFFPDLTGDLLADNRHWLQPEYLDREDNLVLCIQSFVIKTRHHNILIDACVGNHKPRPSRPFWDNMNSDRFETSLSAAGLGFGDIDYVMCTHLHGDHVGWNTKLDNGRWVPTFPKAKYLMADRELAFWTQRGKDNPAAAPWIADSVLPIVAAKREEIVKSDFAFSEDVRLLPTPGHTIDHFSVLVGRAGNDLLITGDMIHSPLQAKYPAFGMMSDYDSKQAGATRRTVFDRFAGEPTVMCVSHFPAPSTGRFRRAGDGYEFVKWTS